jgi:hypothetical protein
MESGCEAPRILTSSLAFLGGLVLSVLANGPNVRGFKPGRMRGIFKGDKNPQQAFLLVGSKAEGPFRKILLHVKITWTYERDISWAKFIISFASSPILLLDDFAGRIARELW